MVVASPVIITPPPVIDDSIPYTSSSTTTTPALRIRFVEYVSSPIVESLLIPPAVSVHVAQRSARMHHKNTEHSSSTREKYTIGL